VILKEIQEAIFMDSKNEIFGSSKVRNGLLMEKNKKNQSQETPSCCAAKPKKEPKNIWQGIAYGLIPHVGCIAFIIGSVLGVTVLMQFFRPLLMNRNFFYILIAISLMFATISSMVYLNKNGWLSFAGMRKKWKYLATMYGSTIGINLLLFMVLFPLLANVSVVSAEQSGNALGTIDSTSLASMRLKVDIPCPGHAPLISNELKTIDGVTGISFSFPNIFDVTYDPVKASKEEILGLSVFQEYKPTVLEALAATATLQPTQESVNQPPSSGGCGCGGGSGGCGGSTGSCGSIAGGCGGSASGCGGGPGSCGGAKAVTGSTCEAYQ
jgi:hypothetical protein